MMLYMLICKTFSISKRKKNGYKSCTPIGTVVLTFSLTLILNFELNPKHNLCYLAINTFDTPYPLRFTKTLNLVIFSDTLLVKFTSTFPTLQSYIREICFWSEQPSWFDRLICYCFARFFSEASGSADLVADYLAAAHLAVTRLADAYLADEISLIYDGD